MKIVIESGATKSDWRFVGDGAGDRRLLLPGMNVSSMGTDRVLEIISEGLKGITSVEGFYLYTAGVVTDDIRQTLQGRIRELADVGETDIQSDLVGAARALFGKGSGVAAILGTGSNTCFYDGVSVRQEVRSGGYIIGDEGSASVLGRMFLADFIKGLVPSEIAADFSRRFDASYEGIVTGVYKSPSPAGYLGSLAPFIIEHYDHPYIKGLVDSNFTAFIKRSLSRYDLSLYPVGVAGGFGYACREMLKPLFESSGISVSTFCPTPIDGLVKFHSE